MMHLAFFLIIFTTMADAGMGICVTLVIWFIYFIRGWMKKRKDEEPVKQETPATPIPAPDKKTKEPLKPQTAFQKELAKQTLTPEQAKLAEFEKDKPFLRQTAESDYAHIKSMMLHKVKDGKSYHNVYMDKNFVTVIYTSKYIMNLIMPKHTEIKVGKTKQEILLYDPGDKDLQFNFYMDYLKTLAEADGVEITPVLAESFSDRVVKHGVPCQIKDICSVPLVKLKAVIGYHIE